MYKMLTLPADENIFSHEYKTKLKNEVVASRLSWEDIFWEQLLYYVIDVFETMNIQIDYATQGNITYLIFYTNNYHELLRVNWIPFSKEIRRIWSSDECNNFEDFDYLLRNRYESIFKEDVEPRVR